MTQSLPRSGAFAIVPQCNSRKAPSAFAGAAQQVTSYCASDGRRTCRLSVGPLVAGFKQARLAAGWVARASRRCHAKAEVRV